MDSKGTSKKVYTSRDSRYERIPVMQKAINDFQTGKISSAKFRRILKP